MKSGFSIYDGNAFTYRSDADTPEPTRGAHHTDARRKIVDVFTVEPIREEIEADVWARYNADLAALLQMTREGKRREARGEAHAGSAPLDWFPAARQAQSITAPRTVLSRQTG